DDRAATYDADEGEPLRTLARQMAGVADTPALLGLLCDAGAAQCAASGAAVIKAVGSDGEIVASSGPLAGVRGRRFTLSGSLAREVIRKRDVVSIEDFSNSTRPLIRAAPELRVG